MLTAVNNDKFHVLNFKHHITIIAMCLSTTITITRNGECGHAFNRLNDLIAIPISPTNLSGGLSELNVHGNELNILLAVDWIVIGGD